MNASVFKGALLGTTACLVVAFAHPARSAESSGDVKLEEVVVTGSRAIKDGSRAPTPLTVLSADEVQRFGAVNVADMLAELPQFRASQGPASNGPGSTYPGQNFLNLRGLGAPRTLVLVNGRRFVPSTVTQGVDINVIPQGLISRSEVVTGGASAAYGSDAVAGVMNFVLDTRFEGFKGDIQYGISGRVDDANYKGSISAGANFLDGRGHLVLSGEYARSEGVPGHAFSAESKRPWLANALVQIPNPAVSASNPASPANPRTILIPNGRLAVANYNGVIQSGPFANMQFTADGNVVPFNPGSPRSGTNGSGGDGWNYMQMQSIDNPLTRNNLYGAVTFDLTKDVTAFGEVSTSYSHTKVPTAPSLYTQTNFAAGFPIKVDNPYLSDAFRAQMSSLGLSQVLVNVVSRQLPIRNLEALNQTNRIVVGLDGKIGAKWSWEAYYQYGQNHGEQNGLTNTILTNFLLATDAVRNPANGQIVCRSTLTSPNNGCVPLNIIGDNPIPADARKYIQGDMRSGAVTSLEVLEASVHGELLDLPAGPLSVAGGASWLKQGVNRTSDPISQSINPVTGRNTGAWFATNVQPLSGGYSNWEVFGEAAAPILSDLPLVHALDLNAAVRYTNYSLSGGVTTWKVGAVYSPIADLRLRITRSRDVRAPGLSELFQGTQGLVEGVIDRTLPGSPAYTVIAFLGGNTALTPESADTLTYGLVYQPSWLRGATLSLDAYAIDIKDAIGTLTSQQILDQCQGGATALCGLILRDPTTGRINSVLRPNLNQSQVKMRGLDVEFSYARALGDFVKGWDGTVRLRFMGNYLPTYESITAPGTAPINMTGGGDRPKWLATTEVAYDRGPLSVDIRNRWIGAGDKLLNLTSTDIDPAANHVKDVFYTDLAVRYRFEHAGANFEVFGAIDNIFDPRPPLFPTSFALSATDLFVYDAVGRSFKVGARFRY